MVAVTVELDGQALLVPAAIDTTAAGGAVGLGKGQALITKNVEADALAVARGAQEAKPGRAKRFRDIPIEVFRTMLKEAAAKNAGN